MLNIVPDDELARRTVGRGTGRAWSCLLERARARQGWAQLAVPLAEMSESPVCYSLEVLEVAAKTRAAFPLHFVCGQVRNLGVTR
jgi:hypothetical protein